MNTILLIEDNPADSNLVREALEEHEVECELLLITNGEKAIEFIRQVDAEEAPPPDLVILDLNLPIKPGSRVLEQFQASSRCARAKIIVLSSSDSHKDKEQAARLGASRYYKKPTRLMEYLKLGGVFKQMLAGAS
jgi:chemotaxis family two-component system response regulator Rcp1